METKGAKHLHSFQRIKKRNHLYMCTKSECNYYASKDFLLGKKASCRFCGNEFILDATQLKRKDPRCIDCRKKKVVKHDDLLDKLLGEGI